MRLLLSAPPPNERSFPLHKEARSQNQEEFPPFNHIFRRSFSLQAAKEVEVSVI